MPKPITTRMRKKMQMRKLWKQVLRNLKLDPQKKELLNA
jgi:hypothetical protein